MARRGASRMRGECVATSILAPPLAPMPRLKVQIERRMTAGAHQLQQSSQRLPQSGRINDPKIAA
jgi:hypothetical protein